MCQYSDPQLTRSEYERIWGNWDRSTLVYKLVRPDGSPPFQGMFFKYPKKGQVVALDSACHSPVEPELQKYQQAKVREGLHVYSSLPLAKTFGDRSRYKILKCRAYAWHLIGAQSACCWPRAYNRILEGTHLTFSEVTVLGEVTT